MVEKNKESEIKVTDRRLFNAEGELRPEATDEETSFDLPPLPDPIRPHMAVAESIPPGAERQPPPLPTEAEQQASREAFHAAGHTVDQAVRDALGPENAQQRVEISFEGFVASLYMSAMFQLGLLHEQGQRPQVDLVGARHTIDTISMLEEKTRGNLSDNEKAIVQDCLFRLRMAFVELTNALTRPPADAVPPGSAKK